MAEAAAKCPDGIDIELRHEWLMDLAWATERFEEPLATESMNQSVEETCVRLKQQHDVLVLSIEIFECYCRHLLEQATWNEGLAATCSEALAILLCVWVANKMIGGQEVPIDRCDVEDYRAEFLPGCSETADQVKAMELEIVKASMHKLKPSSLMDDVRLVAFCLMGTVKPLVVELCVVVYTFTRMCWREVHSRLARTFDGSGEELEELLERRVVMPICVFVAVMKMSRSTKEATYHAKALGKLCRIGARHLLNLAGIIADVTKIRLALRMSKQQSVTD